MVLCCVKEVYFISCFTSLLSSPFFIPTMGNLGLTKVPIGKIYVHFHNVSEINLFCFYTLLEKFWIVYILFLFSLFIYLFIFIYIFIYLFILLFIYFFTFSFFYQTSFAVHQTHDCNVGVLFTHEGSGKNNQTSIHTKWKFVEKVHLKWVLL